MKFTVFGASGFVGSYLVGHLRSLGHEVSAVSRENFPQPPADLGHCIYAIGLTADFRTRPFDTIEAHVSTAAKLLRDYEFQSFLYLSSTRVYARSAEAHEETVLSALPSDPSDLYNLSKLTGESICLSCDRKNVRIARLSNVIGPDEAMSDTFVGELCREAHRGHIELRSDPESSKDYIWIGDVADLLTRIAIEGQHPIYNVASGMELAHQAWISGLSAITGCSVSVAENAPLIRFPRISTNRIVDEFGYAPSPVLSLLPTMLERPATSNAK
jgi:nucleoside-diphosphate-sugar epimerase